MTDTTKRVASFLAKVVTSLVCAAVGVYILWGFHTTAGLVAGCLAIALSLGIAFPTQFHDGVTALRSNAVLLFAIVADAKKGGARFTDPPADTAPTEPTVDPTLKEPPEGQT